MGLIVNGKLIAEEKIIAMMDAYRDNYQKYVTSANEKPSEEQLRLWMEDTLIEDCLLEQNATQNFPDPAEKYIKQELRRSAKKYQGLAPDVARKSAILNMKLLLFKKSIEKNIPHISEETCKKYYNENSEMFQIGTQYTFTHLCIYLDDETTSVDATLQLLSIKNEVEKSVNPNAWPIAVSQYSNTAKYDNGHFGTVIAGELPPEIEKKLFSLKKNEISDVIDTGKGTVELFRLEKIYAPRHLSFNEVKNILQKNLFKIATNDAIAEATKKMRLAATIERDNNQ